ncbi:hypothetical protein PORY_002590 [Pneumocystis oryctolagi]|uniref:Uncharacterized protein n=1 Tax=Pneumocystis oryctolagi TaxID=42067 RepID=A0ACB7C8Q2_9ASCO|nr:hypothetical protein PORY_002590 [Pneumocystis oryctolagi]
MILKIAIIFFSSLNLGFAYIPMRFQKYSDTRVNKSFQTSLKQPLEHNLHKYSICTDVLDNKEFSSELIKCVKKIAKDSYCGGSYDLKCLCDSDHFVFSTGYVKTYEECFRALNSSEHYSFFSYFQNLCSQVTSFNEECLKLNSPPEPIICPYPYKGMKWGDDVLACLLKELEQSNCKKPYDAHCLCDSQSHWKGVNKCLQTAEINTLFMAQHIRKSLCHNPMSLPGCSNVSEELSECSDVFENKKLDSKLENCLKDIAKNTYCEGSTDPTCLCDSKIFECSTNNPNSYDKCFSSLTNDIHSSYLSFKQRICKDPKLPSRCIIKNKFRDKTIFYELYKDLKISKSLKQCLKDAAENSLCKIPYDALCLCDSISYQIEVIRCISGVDDKERAVVNTYLTSVCENPDSVTGSIKESELSTICKDVYENSNFTDDFKKCLRTIAKESYCKGSYDPTCLCNSNYYIESTLYVSTYHECFRLFTVEEHIKYSDYHRLMCTNPQSPPTQCLGLRSFHKSLLCPDIYKGLELSGPLEKCIKNALKKSSCEEPYSALCLCDSKSFWDAINRCIISSTNEEYKLIRNFRQTLCKSPDLLPGCNKNDTFVSTKSKTSLQDKLHNFDIQLSSFCNLFKSTTATTTATTTTKAETGIKTSYTLTTTLIIPGITVPDSSWRIKIGNIVVLILNNIMDVKLSSPDYKGKDPEKSTSDFLLKREK